jgi:GH43 family beta-xylosidase
MIKKVKEEKREVKGDENLEGERNYDMMRVWRNREKGENKIEGRGGERE